MTNKEFAKIIYAAAEKCSDISPLFITAQAALESGWGKSKVGEYNLFGITKGSWTGKTILIQTTEIHSTDSVKYNVPEKCLAITKLASGKYRYSVMRLFRDYGSLEACLSDHLVILQKPHFDHAWAYRKSPEIFVEKLQSGKMKYATDPNYASSIKAVIKTVQKLLV